MEPPNSLTGTNTLNMLMKTTVLSAYTCKNSYPVIYGNGAVSKLIK